MASSDDSTLNAASLDDPRFERTFASNVRGYPPVSCQGGSYGLWKKSARPDAMSKNTRSNHFSPKFSNQYWAAESGSITRLRRGDNGKIWKGKTSAKNWGCEDYLYPQDVEDAYAAIETRIAPIYGKLIRHAILGPIERLIWSHWILCQFARTPTMMLEIAGFGEDVFRMVDTECNFGWDEVGKNISALASHGLTFPSSRELIAFIALRDWIILRPAEGEFFIKGDVPVVMRGPLVDDNAEIVYPLSPDRCFVATVMGAFPPHQVQADGVLKEGATNRFHRMVASASEREVICHPDHFNSALITLVQENLGKSVKFIKHSKIPTNW